MIGMEETFRFQLQEKEPKEEIFTTSFQNSFSKTIVVVLLEESMILLSQITQYLQRLKEMDFVGRFHNM